MYTERHKAGIAALGLSCGVCFEALACVFASAGAFTTIPIHSKGGGICREKESAEAEDGVAEVDDAVAMGDEDHRVVRKL